MSDHSDEEQESNQNGSGNVLPVDDHVDEETLRIMIATDTHLGYAERDPIRGNDSFAAFEEILLLAKRHKCDMVLHGGDLFHENKPSRQTLHKTLSILRKYTMGPDPVSFQIVSDQATNFRSAINSTVNYEDPYYSVDLPIFGIHGNHDDPTRDGGSEMLSAMDLVAVSNLINYFGRQDEVDKVQVSPILLRKGSTKVALYGIGSMRDERLNRMWQGKKVKFLKPQEEVEENDSDEDDDEDENQGWFNIFAIHQNRDTGRGSKNCVHESMIPEWMDFVVWGHEHECLIHPSESAVGTFRITQPGSSVATTLSDGEAMRKQVGILDVRGSQFRMVPVPLRSVRPFAVGNLTLSENSLDPEDPRIEDQMTKLLANEVKKLIKEARQDAKDLRREIESANRTRGGEDDEIEQKLHHRLVHPDQVLVRLKVEHSGFGTLHNQRFGSMFVKQVANPSDILLFHRRRTTRSKSSKGGGKSALEQDLNDQPVYPADLDNVDVEDIVKDTLDSSEKKMMVLDDSRLSIAVGNYVSKETRASINDNVEKMLNVKQKKLIKRGMEGDDDGENENKLTTVNAIREMCQNESQDENDDISMAEDDIEDDNVGRQTKTTKTTARTSSKRSASRASTISLSNDSDLDMESPPKKKKATTSRSQKSTASTRTRKRAATTSKRSTYKSSSEDEIEEVMAKKPAPRRRAARKATLKSKPRYASDDEDEFVDDQSDVEVVSASRPSARSSSKRSRAALKSYADDSGDDDNWGTASSSFRESSSQRSRRRL